MRLYGFLSWILLATIAVADPLDTWTWRNPLPTGRNIRTVVYGGGRFVAAGEMGTVLVSTDTTNWVDRSVQTRDTFGSSAYGNGRFVAVGGTIITSTDSTNWFAANPGTGSAGLAVAFGNGQFVAVGYQTIQTSSDGINWVRRGTNTSGQSFLGVAYGNGLFMITVNSSGVVWVSPDGVNWSQRPPFGLSGFGQVTFGSGLFLAYNQTGVGGGGGIISRLAASVDGNSWTSVLSPAYFPDFNHDGTRFIAIKAPFPGGSSEVFTSVNGFNWTNNPGLGLPIKTHNFYQGQIAYGGGTYVYTFDAMFRSGNLTNWAPIRSSLPISAARVLLSGNGKMVLAGTGPILLSTNGFDYKTNATSGTFGAGAFGTNTFILSSGGGSIVTSTNGSDWTARVTGGSSINALAYGSNTFIAVGEGGDIRVSASGTGWSGRFSGTSLGLNGVAYGNGTFAAVGTNGVVLTSTDTINWTIQDAGTLATLRSITFGNGVFVATGHNGTLRVSSDAVQWNTIISGTTETLSSSATTGGTLLVAGSSNALSSVDGFNWQRRLVPLPLPAPLVDPAPIVTIGTTPKTFVLMGRANIVESGVLSPIRMFAPSYTSPDTFHVKVTGDPGTTARLQRFASSSNWIDVLTYTNSGGQMPLTVNGATNSTGIYRVISP